MAEKNHRGVPMLQAEVGGGARVDLEQRLQRPGYLIRDITLNSIQGKSVQISDYRGRSNLVLVFAAEATMAPGGFLKEAASQERAFAEEEAVVIGIVACQVRNAQGLHAWAALAVLVLADDDGRAHRAYGAVARNGRLAPLIYITDRFGEIAAVYPGFDGKELPSTEQVLKELEFLNHQCPECEPPEWPR